jgi:hypothetical protein
MRLPSALGLGIAERSRQSLRAVETPNSESDILEMMWDEEYEKLEAQLHWHESRPCDMTYEASLSENEREQKL